MFEGPHVLEVKFEFAANIAAAGYLYLTRTLSNPATYEGRLIVATSVNLSALTVCQAHFEHVHE